MRCCVASLRYLLIPQSWRSSRGWARESSAATSYLRLTSQVAMDSASKSHLGISAAPVPLLIKGSAFERLADSGGRSILGEGESAWAERAKMLISAKALFKFQALESKTEAPKYTDKYAMPEGYLGRKADWELNGDSGYGRWCKQCPQDDPTFTCSLVNTADDGTEYYICMNCHEENQVKDKCGKSKPTRSDPFNLRHINAAEVNFETVCTMKLTIVKSRVEHMQNVISDLISDTKPVIPPGTNSVVRRNKREKELFGIC